MIQSATLSLYKFSSYDHSFGAHRMLVDWAEDEATWYERFIGVPWSQAGASGGGTDYSAVADGEGSVTWNPQWLDIDVTGGVQALSAGAASYGWRLLGTGEQRMISAVESPSVRRRVT